LLVVVGILTVMLSGVAVALHTLSRVDRQLRAEAPGAEALTRLSLRLREDAHGAAQWTIEQSGEGTHRLRLMAADQSVVEYEPQRERILRIHRSGDRRLHQELYRVPGAGKFQWELRSEPGDLVNLYIALPRGNIAGGRDSTRWIKLTAAVGAPEGTPSWQ
jgi:hypothetical protein